MHRLLHLSMTFLLIAILLYQRRSYALGYLVATFSLFTYEAFYLPFLIAPVLRRDFRNRPLRTLIIHWIVFFGIAGAVLVIHGWIVSGGVIAIAFSYCLAFRAEYFPPTATQGRASAVHLSAVFGWSVAFGAIFSCFYDVSQIDVGFGSLRCATSGS